MNAWVTLLTKPGYLPGVRTLRASLERSGSAYPLVVMVTEDIDADARQLLLDDGCRLVDVQPLRLAQDSGDGYANARFAEVWTKLAVWRLTQYERVVFLDADMLVLRNMDELFALELADGTIAACHACRCNPNRIPSYPASWTPEICGYTNDRDATADDYLNGGLLVLTPDEKVFEDFLHRLAEVEDLSRYPFAEQDFLNEYYLHRWQPLPYVYNALKTLAFQHPTLWALEDVKNIHFIIDKPWERVLQPGDRYFELHRLWWDVASDRTAPGLSPRGT